MKILMLGWELPPHNSGGLGVACYQMSKALALAGATIDFVVPYRAQHPESAFMTIHSATPLAPFEYDGLGAYDRPSMDDALHRAAHDGLGGLREVQSRYNAYVSELVQESSPDVIHAHDWLTVEAGIAAKKLTGAPLILHVHATEFDRAGNRYGHPLVHEIEQEGLMMADRIIAVSRLTKALIVQRYGVPADKIEVVHNAVEAADITDYDYDARTYRYLDFLRSEGYTVVAALTRFTVQKGLTHFLQAAARASERYDRLVFLLAGDGDQRQELIRLSADLGIADKVFFTGFVRGRQWRDAYRVADIFVMSSVSEPFGLTALEAARHRNALIISKQSGVGEVLRSVLRYDFWDIDRLADQMIAVATSEPLRSELVKNVSREYRNLSWAGVAKQCLSLYRGLPAGARSA
jgi:glycosyltransferase involved in cell wall biosynthesis